MAPGPINFCDRDPKKPIFVSFFTPDNGYAEEATELLKTLKAFGLNYDVRRVVNLGDWTENCGQKPAYLLRMMDLHPGRPLVWVDADARIRRNPMLFNFLTGCDFAAHWRDGKELLSGTMYWGATPMARQLLELWRDRMQNNTKEWDQRGLQELIQVRRSRLVIGELPASYTMIFDTMAHEGPPVIEHTQASRKLRVDTR